MDDLEMSLDDTILQSKTVCNIMKVLKEAATITRTGSNDCERINKDIQYIVKRHARSSKTRKAKRKGYYTDEYLNPQKDKSPTYKIIW